MKVVRVKHIGERDEIHCTSRVLDNDVGNFRFRLLNVGEAVDTTCGGRKSLVRKIGPRVCELFITLSIQHIIVSRLYFTVTYARTQKFF